MSWSFMARAGLGYWACDGWAGMDAVVGGCEIRHSDCSGGGKNGGELRNGN